jgi:phospholipid/cholesterol/gamma-HCH transport system permease protein
MVWRILGRIGEAVITFGRLAVYLTSLMCAVVMLAVQPRRWRRTIRQVFARQLLETGVNTMAPVGLVGLLVGVMVVMQAQIWLGKLGQTEWLGPVLVVVVVRELAPLLTNLVMIMRCGSVMTAELATMTAAGKVKMLDAQGIDPLIYLVMPRVAAMVISTFCLTILFILFSIVSGYLFSFTLGLRVLAPGIFLDQVLRALQSKDVLNLLVTTLVPSLLTGVICCSEGLSVSRTSATVPNATRLALSRSTVSLFLVSVTASLLTYL